MHAHFCESIIDESVSRQSLSIRYRSEAHLVARKYCYKHRMSMIKYS